MRRSRSARASRAGLQPGTDNACGKARYRTEELARDALERIASSNDRRGKTPRRPYLCPACGRWHLTSQD